MPESELPVDMTGGKARYAKAAEGDKPVFAYIASLSQPQRDIAERIDVLAARTLPGLKRAVKWGMAYYGVEGGWCFTSGAFVGHVKVIAGRLLPGWRGRAEVATKRLDDREPQHSPVVQV